MKEIFANLKGKTRVGLFNEFQEKWLDGVERLTLEEYTSRGDKSTFSYDIEFGMRGLGSMKGGSALKLGVYNRDDTNQETQKNGISYSNDKQYSWVSKYGKTENEAFETVKQYILSIKHAVQAGKIEEIDKIPLGDTYKWKIAFHFQNKKNPLVLPIFTKKALQLHLEQYEIAHKKMLISTMHQRIKELELYTSISQVFELSDVIWNNYLAVYSNNQIPKGLSKEKIKNATTDKDEIAYMRKSFLIKYSPKHNKLEKSFVEYLNSISAKNIRQNENCIDLLFSHRGNDYICELKPTPSEKDLKYALRMGIGQLLEYSYDNSLDTHTKVIVFQGNPSSSQLKYLQHLEEKYNISSLYEVSYGSFIALGKLKTLLS